MFLSACCCPLIGRNSQVEAVEGQSVEVVSGSVGTQEVEGAAVGGTILQKSESVEEGEEEEPSK